VLRGVPGSDPSAHPLRRLERPAVSDRARRDPLCRGPDACPCGSRRKSRACHSGKTCEWLALPPSPLLPEPRTNIAVRGCYAAITNDCAGKLTREHWLSKSVINTTTGGVVPPIVSGLPWLNGQTKAVGVAALGSKVLCQRHNGALSKADDTAAVVAISLQRYQLELADHIDLDGDGFTLVSGPLFERWLLKLLWGGVASKSLGQHGVAAESLRKKSDEAGLLEYLYRNGTLPHGWGFYGFPRETEPSRTMGSIAINPRSGPDGGIWAIDVDFGAAHFSFGLGQYDGSDGFYRPGCIVLLTAKGKGERIIAFAWPDPGHKALEGKRME
jgi:hypothetical protein